MTAGAVKAAIRRTLTCSYPGHREQVHLVRATLALLLDDCPLVGDAVLIVSELAANAVVHSNSGAPGGWFTVRAEACPGEYVRIEVDDQGGQEIPHRHQDDRPHGLDLVDAFAGAGNWGIHGDAEHGRTAWARLDWPALLSRSFAIFCALRVSVHLTTVAAWPYPLSMNQGKRGRVLVTGATGFVAGHCIGDLLAHGYDVRGTVRNLKTADIAHLRPAIDAAGGTFELAEATLDADAGWAEAASGCDYVMHVASPIPFKAPRHADELIRPAVDGTTRVLTAAAKTGVRRVVCTSSLDVVTRNRATAARQRTEADWSDLAECNAYAKSKLLAEKRAWDLAADHGIELAVVHPGAIIGPPLQVKKESSADIVRRMLAGEMPVIPPLHLAFTDVRDLAAGQRQALEVPEAKGNRYIVANGHLPMTGIAAILKEEYGPRGYKISTRPLPAWVLRASAPFSREARLGADMLGIRHDVTAEKAIRQLGWTPRPLRESVLDTAQSLISAGIVKPRPRAAS